MGKMNNDIIKRKIEKLNAVDVVVKIFYFLTGLAHVLITLFTITELQGHAYGSPDKYGSYNYGLYDYEVEQIEKNIKAIWFMTLGIAILGVIILIVYSRRKSYGFVSNNTSFSKFNAFLIILFFVCLVGAIWTSFKYGQYH